MGIVEALQSNCSLQVHVHVLDIYYYQIGSMGFDPIAKLLESNTTLRKLHLVDKQQ